MASLGFLETLLNGLTDATTKSILKQVFTELVKFEKFGPIAHQEPTQIGARVYLESTTADASTTEFSIAHGLGRAPYFALQVLPLDSSGAQLVPLVVSRVADVQRVYFRSTSTSAVFFLMAE